MKQVLMSQLAVQVRGVSYKPDDLHSELNKDSIMLLRANNIDNGKINFDDVIYVDRSKVSDNQLLRNGDILICASSGSKNLVGKAAQVDFDGEVTFGAFCKVVRPTTIEANYLGMYFQSPTYRSIISALARGANINNIKNENIDTLLVNVPAKNERTELVKILKKVQAVIHFRLQQLQKLDELVKARFVEMFGSPLENNKGFPMVLGESLFKLSNGKALPSNKRFAEGIPAYGGNGISLYTDEVLCTYDTIIVGRVGFQSGNVHLAKAPLWVTDNAMYISNLDNKKCDIRFLCALMEHIDFTRYQDAGDLKKITQKPFMQMYYLIPPIQLQKQYIAFIEQTGKAKATIQKALDETQLLFDSLMQKYFG